MLNGGENSEPCQFKFASDKPEEQGQQTCILLSSSQLLNLALGGFLCHDFSMCSEASRFIINKTVGYGTTIMLRIKRKSFLEKNIEDFEIVPLAGKHELGWLGLM